MYKETRTFASSPLDCQERCQNTPECRHFTFFPDGGCHIQDRKSRLDTGGDQVISGPVHCDKSHAAGNAPGAAPGWVLASSPSPSPSLATDGQSGGSKGSEDSNDEEDGEGADNGEADA